MTNKFKQGNQVTFKRVTRKYACKHGIIKEKITLYTDGKIKYPDVSRHSMFGGDVGLFLDPADGRTEVQGYVVGAIGHNGQHREDVIVSEGFLTLGIKTPPVIGSFDSNGDLI